MLSRSSSDTRRGERCRACGGGARKTGARRLASPRCNHRRSPRRMDHVHDWVIRYTPWLKERGIAHKVCSRCKEVEWL